MRGFRVIVFSIICATLCGAPLLLHASTVSSAVQVTSQSASGLVQSDYRWYANTDALTPSTALAAENTPTSTPIGGTVVRLRANAKSSNTSTNAGVQLKLQYYQATSTATSTNGIWVDMTTSTTLWVLADNPSVADGQALGSTVLSDSDVAESYEEANPTIASPNAIATGEKGEWDWVIKNNAANPANHWYFRAVYASSTELEGYEFSTFPHFEHPTPETDAISSLAYQSGGTHTLSLANGATSTVTLPANYYTYDLTLVTFSYPSSTFLGNRPAPSGKFFAGKVFDFNFYSATTSITTLLASTTITIGYQDSDVSSINEATIRPYRMAHGVSTWSQISGATVNTSANTVTFATDSFSSFALIGDPVSSGSGSSGSGSSGGGGGGGGGGGTYVPPPSTTVIFHGVAYPTSNITLLKDAQVVATTKAGPDASFEISLTNVSVGTHLFGIWAEDARGNRSVTHTFIISVTSGVSTVVSGIFIPPAFSLDKSEVRRGDILTFLGSSAPAATISIVIGSEEELVKTTAAADGTWIYKFDTTELDYGDHTARASATRAGDTTNYSQVKTFRVGTRNVFAPSPTKTSLKGDVNKDGRVNLVDFSIMAYWYKRPNPPDHVDMNADRKVNLADFSIMAYFWTG